MRLNVRTLNMVSRHDPFSIGEWRRDTMYGFGVYYYMNGDIYEGSWKRNFRHGLGTYVFADTGTKFMGTWIRDRMQGPGQLIHPRHRFHGHWETNLPYGRGCFTFENSCMQHGHYVHVPDPNYQEPEEEPENERKEIAEAAQQEGEEGAGNEAPKQSPEEEPVPLKKGVIAMWRARCITSYNPDLLPPEPVPLQEEVSLESLSDKCGEVGSELEQYLPFEDEYPEGEYGGYYDDEHSLPRPTSPATEPDVP